MNLQYNAYKMIRGLLKILFIFVLLGHAFLAHAKSWPEINPNDYAPTSQDAEWDPQTIKGADPIPDSILHAPPPDVKQYGKNISVTDMVDIALRNSPVTQKAWADAKTSAAAWGRARSEYYPFLDAEVDGAVGHVQNIEGGRSFGEVSVDLKYLLLDFGGRKAKSNAGKQALIASNWMHNQAIQDILRDVPQAYYYHLAARARERAAVTSLKDAKTTLKATETRKQAGVATIADVLQARASKDQALVELESSRGAVQITHGQLATTVGWPANTRFEVVDNFKRFPSKKIEKNVDTLIGQARKHRPELNSAMASVRQKESELRKAKTAAFPKLNAGAQALWRGSRNFNDEVYYGGLQLQIPLFHGFDMRNQIREAEGRLDAARANFRITQENVIQNTWSAFYNFRTAEQQLQTSHTVLASSQESYNVSLERYRVGAADIVELLNAQAMLANARAQLVNARAMVYTSYADLIHAIGMALPY